MFFTILKMIDNAGKTLRIISLKKNGKDQINKIYDSYAHYLKQYFTEIEKTTVHKSLIHH